MNFSRVESHLGYRIFSEGVEKAPCPDVLITIYATMIYTAPVRNVLDACLFIMWGSGRGLGPGIPEFFGPCEMGTSL
jgi:hypothetical protein